LHDNFLDARGIHGTAPCVSALIFREIREIRGCFLLLMDGIGLNSYLISSVAKLAFGTELSFNQSDYVRAGFSPCPARLNEGSGLLSTHRLNKK
jgi:hypothetical protein